MNPTKYHHVLETLQRLTMPHWLQIEWLVEKPYTDQLDMEQSQGIFRVTLRIRVPDRDKGFLTEIKFNKTIRAGGNPIDSEGMILQQGRDMIKYMAVHEMHEHLLLDGTRWNDPHQNDVSPLTQLPPGAIPV